MRIKFAPKQIAVAVMIAVFVAMASIAAFNYLNKLTGNQIDTGDDDGGTVVVIDDDTASTMLLQFGMKDILNSRALKDDTDAADFWVGNSPTFDLSTPYVRAHEVAAAAEVTDDYFSPGQTVIVHCYSDEDPDQESQVGYNYYDSWFVFELTEGEDVYWFDFIDTAASTAGDVRYTSLINENAGDDYTYTLKSNWKSVAKPTGYKVSITGGTTPYWDVGQFKLWPRIISTDLDCYVQYAGTVLDKVTDAAANTTEGADGVGTTPTAITGKTNVIDILIQAASPDTGYGKPLLYVTSQGQIKSREAYLIVYMNQTTVGHDYLVDHGWEKLSISTLYAGVAYYMRLPSLLPNKNARFNYDIDLYLDTTDCTVSAGLSIIGHFADGQDLDSLKLGTYATANPTFYGQSEWGLDNPEHNLAVTISSGLATQAQFFAAVQNSA